MFSREDLQNAFRGIVEEKGLSLFDIDYPTVSTPTLRVYIWRMPSSNVEDSPAPKGDAKDLKAERRGVTLDECAQVARAITSWLETNNVEGSDAWLLEVSSPGINRRLRLKEHFESAIGERVKLKLFHGSNSLSEAAEPVSKELGQKRESIVGQLIEVGESSLVIRAVDETIAKGRKIKRSPSSGAVKKINVTLGSIEEARVDFVF